MTTSTTSLTAPLAALATRLQEDAARLRRGEEVGDSGVVAPRTNGAQDKRDGSARALARHLYPCDNAERQQSYTQYGRLIARLRKTYLDQEELRRDQEHTAQNPFRRARVAGNRQLFEKLLMVDPSIEITEPRPMPVTVASEVELTPIFSHLHSGDPTKLERHEFDRGAVFQDGRIDMCKQVVGPSYIGALTAAVTDNPYVQHFLIGNNIVGDSGAAKIANMVAARSHENPIETLYLAGNKFTADGTKALAEVLATDAGVTSLWLKRNPLGAEGVGHLAQMLRRNTTLEVLDLVNTAAGDDGVRVLFEALRDNTKLRVLYLDANAITVEGAQAIADYFRFLKAENRVGLTGLFLGINRLGDDGAIELANGIIGYQPLTRLDLGSNRIQLSGLRSVLDAATTIPDLSFLGLGLYKSTSDMGELPNYFDGDGIDLLIDYLQRHDNISGLDLKDTNLRPSGWPDLVKALEQNPTIVDLAFTQFGLTLPRPIHDGIEQVLRRNIEARFGVSLSEFRQTQLRYMKHPEQVRNIDSMYRNAMYRNAM